MVNVGYRLAPEHRYPVANDEAYGAVEWVAAQHVSLGLDPARHRGRRRQCGWIARRRDSLRARDAGGPTLVQQVLVYPGIERRSPRQSMVEFADSPFLCATVWIG
ncbi:alpha/beta hydrolase fold domain-containing protein [Rhodococcus hoagii]|nr:alpha/beta hydrolase fold domain-containing protein [Prescottella equi]